MSIAADAFRIEMIGHASMRIHHRGTSLVVDPWWIDPLAPHSAAHYPPLVHDIGALAAETDAIYVSHVHADHFHPPTLRHFAPEVPVYIAEHRNKRFRDAVVALGLRVVECPFREPVAVGASAIELTMLEHDYDENAAFDSSVVVATPEFTVFDNNDCVLAPEKYDWVRSRWAIDYAFLGYSPASHYPICFEMEASEKHALLSAAAERRYGDFVRAARRLQPGLAVPFASGARFLEEGERWKNAAFNSAAEAVRRLGPHGIAGTVLAPGDRIDATGSVVRHGGAPPDDAPATIEQYARAHADDIAALYPSDPQPSGDVTARLRSYLLERWRHAEASLTELRRCVIGFDVDGEVFHVDFSRPRASAFAPGIPPDYDMLFRYSAAALQRKLDGEVDWDELHFSRGVAVHQRRYAKDYVKLLRSELLDLGTTA